MPVEIWNFKTRYVNARGKWVFAPTEACKEKGHALKALVENAVGFEPFYYHLRRGGHVAALHTHRPQRFFARVDIKNFFYSISKSRVAGALHDIGIPAVRDYAKWSCVKNPLDKPAYALPYGFVQSPILASLVLRQSSVGTLLRGLSNSVAVSVYVDDIAISGADRAVVDEAFDRLLQSLEAANFALSPSKTAPTAEALELFNCELRYLHSAVTPARIERFQLEGKDQGAFDRYLASVEAGNG
jgi:hypothetical protein